MLIYSGAVALYLAYAGLALGFASILLWLGGRPARNLTILLARPSTTHEQTG